MAAKSKLLSRQITVAIVVSIVLILFTLQIGLFTHFFFHLAEFYFWYILFPLIAVNILALLIRYILRIRAIQAASEEEAKDCSRVNELLRPRSAKVISGLGWIPLASVCILVVLSIAGISVRPASLPASVAQTLRAEYDDEEIESISVSRFFNKSAVMMDVRYSIGSEYKLMFQLDIAQNVSSHFVDYWYADGVIDSAFRSIETNDDGTLKYTQSEFTYQDAMGVWFKTDDHAAVGMRTQNSYVIMRLDSKDSIASDEALTREKLIPMCYELLTEKPNYVDEGATTIPT